MLKDTLTLAVNLSTDTDACDMQPFYFIDSVPMRSIDFRGEGSDDILKTTGTDRFFAAFRRGIAGGHVMGTRGRSGLAHVMVGSVAERTLRLAPCPVLTVKTPVEDEAWDMLPQAKR